MYIELKNKSETYNIEFIFNYTKQKIILSLEYILSSNKEFNELKELKTIIKEECLKNQIILYEDNIVLYDFENDIIINTIDDLILHKTTKCAIMCIPIVCNHNH
jgi:hypothetical protein